MKSVKSACDVVERVGAVRVARDQRLLPRRQPGVDLAPLRVELARAGAPPRAPSPGRPDTWRARRCCFCSSTSGASKSASANCVLLCLGRLALRRAEPAFARQHQRPRPQHRLDLVAKHGVGPDPVEALGASAVDHEPGLTISSVTGHSPRCASSISRSLSPMARSQVPQPDADRDVPRLGQLGLARAAGRREASRRALPSSGCLGSALDQHDRSSARRARIFL